MAPSPSEPSKWAIIHSAHLFTAKRRMKFGPKRSHFFKKRSRRRKKLRQLKNLRSRSGKMGAPGRKSSFKLKPAGTGRRGLAACRMESGMTMARVQDDI